MHVKKKFIKISQLYEKTHWNYKIYMAKMLLNFNIISLRDFLLRSIVLY